MQGIVRYAVAGLSGALTLLLGATGCQQTERHEDFRPLQPRVIALAPVLNLSGNQDFDALKVTDLVASEFAAVQGCSVIPVNRTLAELARRGKSSVESAADALDLANTFGADATVVLAITEYNPYDPPVVGMIMQWYGAPPTYMNAAETPPAAHRSLASEQALSGNSGPAPTWQVQRIFNAADREVLRQVHVFAAARDKSGSPYAWRRVLKSQELYLRFCSWALIQPMSLLNGHAVTPDEAES